MILCADDYGISSSVSSAIRELIKQKRISATSCMMTSEVIESEIHSLKNMNADIDIGLHLVLTNDLPVISNFRLKKSNLLSKNGHFHSFKLFWFQCLIGTIDKCGIEAEIKAQVMRFLELFGHYPDFIDGHQHVQQLPVVRDALIAVVSELDLRQTYIRSGNIRAKTYVTKEIDLPMKIGSFLIAYYGYFLSKKLQYYNVATNKYLYGYYNYNGSKSFKQVFEVYLKLSPQHNDIFFCHPGLVDSLLIMKDSLVDERVNNYNFLLSDAFVQLLYQYGISLNTYSYNKSD